MQISGYSKGPGGQEALRLARSKFPGAGAKVGGEVKAVENATDGVLKKRNYGRQKYESFFLGTTGLSLLPGGSNPSSSQHPASTRSRLAVA